MTDLEITALAHEHAEEIYNGDTDFIPEAEQVLMWLLRRFCLVEKTEVKRLLKEHRKENRGTDKESRAWFFYNGRLDLLKSLFPEIAKEVDS